RLRAPLTERALEPRLPAERLVPPSARRTEVGKRAAAAARNACEADGRAEIEERLRARTVERGGGPLLHAAHVRVERQHVLTEREVAQCGRGVRADAGQLRQVLGPPTLGDDARGAMQVDRAAVVAETLPLDDHVSRVGSGERL